MHLIFLEMFWQFKIHPECNAQPIFEIVIDHKDSTRVPPLLEFPIKIWLRHTFV